MILKNTAENRALVAKLSEVIDSEIGFWASVNKNWNCGEDIRLEISTPASLDCPFLVSSHRCADGEIEVKVRMLKTYCSGYEVTEWRDWFVSLDNLLKKLNEISKGGN